MSLQGVNQCLHRQRVSVVAEIEADDDMLTVRIGVSVDPVRQQISIKAAIDIQQKNDRLLALRRGADIELRLQCRLQTHSVSRSGRLLLDTVLKGLKRRAIAPCRVGVEITEQR